jgi:alpha-tubulin suppressor-like RCC1 family protein
MLLVRFIIQVQDQTSTLTNSCLTEIMCSTPQFTHVIDETTAVLPHVTHLVAGNTITIAVIEKKKIYLWGAGVGSQYRIPTLLKV